MMDHSNRSMNNSSTGGSSHSRLTTLRGRRSSGQQHTKNKCVFTTKHAILVLFAVSFAVTYQTLIRASVNLNWEDDSPQAQQVEFPRDSPTQRRAILQNALAARKQALAGTNGRDNGHGRKKDSTMEVKEREARIRGDNSNSNKDQQTSSTSGTKRKSVYTRDETTGLLRKTALSRDNISSAIISTRSPSSIPTTSSTISNNMPPWLRTYLSWHQKERARLSADNWEQKKFLVMSCFHGSKCGGLTDRLRPVLSMLRAAHESKRLFLIYWERPFPLEEFLQPPDGGLDWRVPEYMVHNVSTTWPHTRFRFFYNKELPRTIVTTWYQSATYGEDWYNEQLQEGELPALQVFKDVWNTLFEMAPPVQQLYDTVFASLGLKEGEFATAHIRALYALNDRPLWQTAHLVRNAMNCASQLRPGGPFLVASDKLDALQEAQAYGRERNVTVVAPHYDKEPLHIGLTNESDTSITPTDFYSVFVDIYLLAQSRCVAVGQGGFGHWALLLGYDSTCVTEHFKVKMNNCEWRDVNDNAVVDDGKEDQQIQQPDAHHSVVRLNDQHRIPKTKLEQRIHAKVMEAKEAEINKLEERLNRLKESLQEDQQLASAATQLEAPGAAKHSYSTTVRSSVSSSTVVAIPEKPPTTAADMEMEHAHFLNRFTAERPSTPQPPAIWDNSTLLPNWLKGYFQWHRDQRALMTEHNFLQQRYIIMTCLKGSKCGGMTDRLRPSLAHLQVAHTTKRLFLIYWERPFGLEEFLLPPEGGLDWRMPKYMLEELYKTQRTGSMDLRYYRNPEPMIVSTTYQSWHYGELEYNQRKAEDEPNAMEVFRDVWNTLFTPSPPVEEMIANSFDELGILPGHYSTAHIRALYALEDRGEREIRVMVRNALNCLSQIDTGGPYLVSADSVVAIRLAKEYGAWRNVTVVSPPHGEHPLHLGFHNESDTSIVPANFYNIFHDMYLIAETRCTVVGPGGFGRWGILLGHEPTCNKFSSGFKAESCEWKDGPSKEPALLPPEEEGLTHHRHHAKMPFRKPMA